MAPFCWWWDQLAVWCCIICHATSSSHPIGGRIAEGPLHGTYSGISNLSQITKVLYREDNSYCFQWNGGWTQHCILSKFSGVTHTLTGCDRVVYESEKLRQDTMLRILMQSVLFNTCRYWHKWSSKRITEHSKWDTQWHCVQPTSFPSPLQLNKTTDHFHLHTCPWGLQFGRWTWWEASVHSLIHPILT